jgi:hypothetical protein
MARARFTLAAAGAALLLLASSSTLVSAARVPNSPYPVCSGGLNSSSTLFAWSEDSGSPSDDFTIQTLQGVLSKKSPRVYRYDPNNPAPYELWLNETARVFGVTVDRTYFNDAAGLIRHFASELVGYVLVDLSDNSTNVAVAAAAALDVIAVTPSNAALAMAAGLSQLYDLRGRTLEWAIAHFNNTNGFTYSDSVTVVQSPSGQFCMGDYSIASGALQWWQDDIISPTALGIWLSMRPAFVMLGWGPDEYDTVTAVSIAGGSVVASNWASGLDVFSQFDIPQFQQKPAPPQAAAAAAAAAAAVAAPAAPASAVHTACFLMSDGDNVQWLIDGFATGASWFGSPDRGHVNLGWTLGPSTSDLAPVLLNYLYENAGDGVSPSTPYRDVFVAGVSGMGYMYPDAVLTPASLAAVAQGTSDFMRKAGMRIVNVLAHGEGYADDAIPGAYLAHDNIDAVLYYNYGERCRSSSPWSIG